jgi:hypothetical protein
MKVLSRILIALGALGVFLALCLIFIYWVFPVGLSIWTVWKAPSRARFVPIELKDLSISHAAGSKLDYFGYEFDVPWNDITGSRNANSNRAVVTFRSGLQLSATALPAREFVNTVAVSWFHVSPQEFESKLGYQATHSDYEFLKRLYAFTPHRVNLWAMSPSIHYRDIVFLTLKFNTLVPWAADSGVFQVGNQGYKGFQEGSPAVRPLGIIVDLYADDGAVEFIFDQKNYQDPTGVSQPEINRVIQSLHKASETAPQVR